MSRIAGLALCAMLCLAGCADLKKRGDFAGLVDIGNGRKLYMECEGVGTPVVVLIPGKGGPARATWRESFLATDPVVLAPEDLASAGQGDSAERDAAVFQQIRHVTRACSYDRPNTRFDGADVSTPVTQPRTAGDAAADLHALLAASGEPVPYVLVAHSYGGYIAEIYARRYPEDVAGLVMVDAGSHFVRSASTPDRFACWHRFHRSPAVPQGEGIEPAQDTDAIVALPPLRVMPAAVLSAQKANPAAVDEMVRSLAGCEVVTHPEWLAAQQSLAIALHTTNVVAFSGHFVQSEQPTLVVDAIRQVVDAVRKAH